MAKSLLEGGSKYQEVRELEEKTKHEVERELAYKEAEKWFDRYRLCFNTKVGKKVLEDLIRFIGSQRPTVNATDNLGRVDPIKMGFREGLRRVEIHINGRMTKPTRQRRESDE